MRPRARLLQTCTTEWRMGMSHSVLVANGRLPYTVLESRVSLLRVHPQRGGTHGPLVRASSGLFGAFTPLRLLKD